MMVEYIMNLQLRKKKLSMHRSNIVRRALPYVKEVVARRMKAETENVTVDKDLNNFIIANINRLNTVKIKIAKDGDTVKISLPEDKKVVVENKGSKAADGKKDDVKGKQAVQANAKDKKQT